ncbi:Major pollen allergen Lol p 11 [Nymphaea thermarum]|nr:Major pollen allergen Lol p 11 [Nymphaea thermarum]
MESFTTPLFLLTLTSLLCFASAQHGRGGNPSAVVIGTVFCDTCSQRRFSSTSHFISGATVAIECGDGKGRSIFKQEVRTDRRGEFKVELPFPVNHNRRRIKRCSVILVRSSEPDCSVISNAVSSALKLKSTRGGLHIFSAGFFTFKPLHQPDVCSQKPILTPVKHGAFPFHGVARRGSLIAAKRSKRSLSGILNPTGFFSPPTIPLIPSPPAFSFPFPPNPFQPPPSVLPIPPPANPFPNPFQPPPFFSFPNPPNPFRSPPYFPPIPFLNPPPPPPFFSFPPFPPNPFHPPSPLIPGIPPAAPAKTAAKKATSHP